MADFAIIQRIRQIVCLSRFSAVQKKFCIHIKVLSIPCFLWKNPMMCKYF